MKRNKYILIIDQNGFEILYKDEKYINVKAYTVETIYRMDILKLSETKPLLSHFQKMQ